MGNAYIGLGLSRGAANVQQYNRERPEREARLAEAKAKQQLSEMQLQDFKDKGPLRKAQTDVALEQAQQQLAQMEAQSLQSATYKAFDRFESDKDVKHINNFLADAKRNPVGQRMYSNMVRVDEVQQSPETEAMLAKAGIADTQGFFTDPKKYGNFVVATSPAGTKHLVNLDNIYTTTGYTRYATNRSLEDMKLRQRYHQMTVAGVPYEQLSAVERSARAIQEELKIPFTDALAMVNSSSKKAGSTAIERTADMLQEQNPDMPRSTALEKAARMMRPDSGTQLEREVRRLKQENPELSDEEAFSQAKINTQANTTAQKDIAAADAVREDIDKIAGGDIFKADLTDSTIRRKVGPKITALEKLTGHELSTDEKRLAREMRELTKLGGKAGKEMTAAETGVIDNMLHNFKKYMTDSVEGVDATSAYATFRNTLRHALFGSALTDGEIAAFNQAAGTLGQQAGPVLQQLATQMTTIKSQLQSIYDMNDETIAYYRLGTSLDDIDAALEQIDNRIDMISKPENRPTIKDVKTERPPLDEIFK